MRRQEVWWASFPPPIGRRPVLLLSRDAAYAVRTSVTVALITSTIRNIPVEVRLGPQQGLQRECVVNLDEIATIRKSQLLTRQGALDDQTMSAVDQAICFALDLQPGRR